MDNNMSEKEEDPPLVRGLQTPLSSSKPQQLTTENTAGGDPQSLTVDVDSMLDSVVRSVMEKFVQRSLVGKKKYNTDLDRTDLTIVDWIQHTQEELMDATLYLEKLKQTMILDTPMNTNSTKGGSKV